MDKLLEQLTNLFRLIRPWVMIAPWEQGVRVRGGRWAKLLLPGVHLVIPLLDATVVHNVRLRAVNLPMQTVTTRDGQTITLAGGVNYKITNLLQLHQNVFGVDDMMIQYAHAEIAACVVEMNARELQPLNLAVAVADRLAGRIEGFGLEAVAIYISDLVRVKTYRVISDSRYGSYQPALQLGT